MNLIKFLIILFLLFPVSANSKDWAFYMTLDLSLVIDEQDYFIGYYKDYEGLRINEIPTDKDQSLLRSTIEVGVENTAGYAFGFRHLSSPLGDCPFNCGEIEYFKNELFIGYKFGGL